MRLDDDGDSVEFVVSEPDLGADEELVQPPGFPRLRRARLPLFAAAAVALIVLIAVNVVNGPSGTPSAGPATVTVSPSSSASSVPTPSLSVGDGVTFTLRPGYVAVLHPPIGRRTAARVEVLPVGVTCPSEASCATLFQTPKAVRAAIHRELPKATHLEAVTTITHGDAPGSQLLARHITGQLGSARLTVTVGHAMQDDRIGWNDTENAQRTVVSATQHVSGQLVSVRVSGPPGYAIGIAAVRGLAADPRLARLA